MPKENDPINDRLDKISDAIVLLTQKVSSLEERVAKSEARKKSNLPLDVPPRPVYRVSKVGVQTSKKTEAPFVPESGAGFYSGKDEGREGGFETEIGLKWLGRVGILALIIGIAFFLKYAFDNDWIGEAGRVAIGIFSGMVLLFLGDYLRQKYTTYAATLTGGGIAVLYLSIYASFSYYYLVEQLSAFIFMMCVTAIGAFLAIRYERISLAILAIMGGFLTPLLLSTAENNQVGLFSYITILNLGVLGISFYRNWQKLNLLGLLATLFIYFAWAGVYYESSELFLTEAFLTLWFIIYAVAVVSHNILSRKKTDVIDLILIILNALVYFGISYALLSRDYSDYLGFFTVLMAALYFVFALVSYQANPEDKELALFFPGLSIFFLTISAPIQFDGIWVTIIWAIEAVVLLFVGFYLKSYAMRVFSWTILVIVILRLVFIDNYQAVPNAEYIMIFNKRFLTFMFGVASMSMVYSLYAKYESLVAEGESKARPIALFLLNFLLLWNLSAEVFNYFGNQIQAQTRSAIYNYPSCQRWENDYQGRYVENPSCVRKIDEYHANVLKSLEIKKDIESKQNAVLNILWSVYAIVLLAFGIQEKNRLLRLMGIGLLGITIARLFFYGIMAMQGAYRIIAFIFIGVVLLAVSYVYNKYKEKIKEII